MDQYLAHLGYEGILMVVNLQRTFSGMKHACVNVMYTYMASTTFILEIISQSSHMFLGGNLLLSIEKGNYGRWSQHTITQNSFRENRV